MQQPKPEVPPIIRGLRLRELLVLILMRAAVPMTVGELADAVERSGFAIEGRPGKVVSDQLRYEVARGRARRLDRGIYGAGHVTRHAKSRMRRRIRDLRAQTQRI